MLIPDAADGFLSLAAALLRIIAPCQVHAVASVTVIRDARLSGGHETMC
jgi:hypothetical protein